SVSVPENTLTSTVVLDVNATDADLPVQGLTYVLSGADALDLAIDAATGQIRFVAVPDYDVPADADGDNAYEVTVTGTDYGSPTQFTTQNLFITVTAVNDLAPVISTGNSSTVPENTATTIVVLDVDATDAEVPAQTVQYELSGVDAADFTIDQA